MARALLKDPLSYEIRPKERLVSGAHPKFYRMDMLPRVDIWCRDMNLDGLPGLRFRVHIGNGHYMLDARASYIMVKGAATPDISVLTWMEEVGSGYNFMGRGQIGENVKMTANSFVSMFSSDQVSKLEKLHALADCIRDEHIDHMRGVTLTGVQYTIEGMRASQEIASAALIGIENLRTVGLNGQQIAKRP